MTDYPTRAKPAPKPMSTEQAEVTALFAEMLAACSKDGGKKLAAGEKVSWKIDQTHEAGLFSHLNKWKHGELIDPDSGAHPLTHLAWRALAIAWQESQAAPSCHCPTCKETHASSQSPTLSVAPGQFDC